LIENPFIHTVLNGTLLVLVLLMIVCVWRVIVGPTAADRLQAIDTITNVLIGVIIILALTLESPFFVDIAIALGAFGFIATIAIARYLSEGDMF
jgi:multisubunit Na+/H+ antiporter MnhF subunit